MKKNGRNAGVYSNIATSVARPDENDKLSKKAMELY